MNDLDNRLTEFVSGTNGEAMCIAGKWGTGKTYAWRRILKAASASGSIGHTKYSYVSLFGSGSISDLRTSIFENAIDVSDIGNPEKVGDVDDLLNRLAGLTRRHATFLAKSMQFLGAKGDFTILTSLFMNVRDYVVCIDDLERRSASLPLTDVLGLVSFLAQERNCKVAVLLNDGELLEGDTATLKKYSEKVFDGFIRFAPEPAYAIEASDLTPSSALRAYCELLGIVNIRVLNKISKLLDQLTSILAPYSDELKKQAAQSVALLGWSVHEPELAPKLSYILNERVSFMYGLKKDDKEVEPEVAAWNALLDKAGFSKADDFDRSLVEGIQNGFFDTDRVKKCAAENDDRLAKSNSESALHQAWEEYHSSFNVNESECIDKLYEAYLANMAQVGIMDLQSVISLFRDFAEDDKATRLIEKYIATWSVNPSTLNFSSYPWISEITDSEIQDRITAVLHTLKRPPDVKQSMLTMFSKGGGIGSDQIEVLSATPVEDYLAVFRESTGDVLKTAISSCLEFDRISNASPDMRTITAKAKQALKILGTESALNARKVKSYGVNIEKTYYPPATSEVDSKPT